METLGAEYERLGKNLEALNYFERVSVLEPNQLEVYIKLGNLYKKEKMYQEALSLYWVALAMKNDDPYFHRSILDIYKVLSDQEIKKPKTLEGQSSFARDP